MPTPKTYTSSRTPVLDCCEDARHEEIHHRSEELFQALVHASLRTHFERLSSAETLYLVTGDGERVQISPEMYGPITSVARAFADRKDVCVVRQDRLMTTQEAADYLGYRDRPSCDSSSAARFPSNASTRTVAWRSTTWNATASTTSTSADETDRLNAR